MAAASSWFCARSTSSAVTPPSSSFFISAITASSTSVMLRDFAGCTPMSKDVRPRLKGLYDAYADRPILRSFTRTRDSRLVSVPPNSRASTCSA